MKIEKVLVDLPYDRGLWERPILTFYLGEALRATSDVKDYRPTGVHWWTQKCGPFISYSCDQKDRETAGHYNVAYRDLADPIVDVQIFSRDMFGNYAPELGNYGLTVKRARQYMRQHEVAFRLLMNDHDGQNGLVSWTPVPKHPRCSPGLLLGVGYCPKIAVQAVYEKGVDIPLCADHLHRHNNRRSTARQSSK